MDRQAGFPPEYCALSQAPDEIVRAIEIRHLYVCPADFTRSMGIATRTGSLLLLGGQSLCHSSATRRWSTGIERLDNIDLGQNLR